MNIMIAFIPDTVWMAGDSPTADIEGAVNAGIPAILVHTPNRCGAEFQANSLKDVIPIIEPDKGV